MAVYIDPCFGGCSATHVPQNEYNVWTINIIINRISGLSIKDNGYDVSGAPAAVDDVLFCAEPGRRCTVHWDNFSQVDTYYDANGKPYRAIVDHEKKTVRLEDM